MVLSVVMSLASFQLIINSIQKIVEFTSRNGTIPTVQLPVILIAAFTVGKYGDRKNFSGSYTDGLPTADSKLSLSPLEKIP